jgi:5'-deoxynucleotidase YfbR-like HD superfamily hydrolase
MIQPDLDKILSFCRLLMQFQAVERFGAEAPAGFRENDAEHSYSLSMMAWYLITTCELDLDANLATQYALAHDLVEVYAGDTHAFGSSSAKASKKLREDLALNMLREQYPEFPVLPDLIHAYEERQDAESRFVYALDKLIPSLMIYLNESHQYVSREISYVEVVEYVEPKVQVDSTIKAIWLQLKPRLANRPELFSTD